ncbi:DUF4114 domain-containing protein [Desulfobacter sp. UBA2225]|uniref:DUF4114 domain-containing protein n=1 Tax=Desulfobacter sp. UBA2225 TaxID=1961413 RepID=UPI00257D4ABF|nr:DUF4114 domain-containing protein [Desulfobacter sp. UBA2225]
MKKKVLASLAMGAIGVGLMAGNAMAVPGAALQGVLDGITKDPIGNSSIDVTTDYITEGLDDYWAIAGSGGSISTIVIELAGYAGSNTFGIYDAANSANFVQIFAGADAAGAQKQVSILGDGSVFVNFADTGIDFAGNNFGYYLDTPDSAFYSDTLLNTDQFDHMFAYQGLGTDTIQIPPYAAGVWGTGEYVLAWEDIVGGGDQDWDDFVVMVESVSPVPEPASMLLFGTGLASLAGLVTRRKKN